MIKIDTIRIKSAFPDVRVPDIDSYYSDEIAAWKRIFENNPSWRRVKRSGLYKKGDREMSRLNVAKVLCDTFSDLTFSEQVDISIDNEQYQNYVSEQLEANGFWKQLPELITSAYALGGSAIKVFIKNDKPVLNYIHADKFLPLEWSGKEITGGVFVSEISANGKYYTLLERHSPGIAEYKLFCSPTKQDIGEPCLLSELFDDLPDMVDYDTDVPMFAYFKPSVSNNVEYDTPLGMSVFANAVDTLKALDIAFDSFTREFVLGKKRIIVPAESLQTVFDIKTGKAERYFDADDEAFVALKTEDNENLKIADNTVELRVEEHVSAINAMLNILCFQVGLSAGSLSFDSVQGLKTATEVVSQDSKTMRTIKSNKNLLTEMFESMIHSIIAVGVFAHELPKSDYNVVIGWQDNIVIDDNTLIDNTIKLYSAGLIDLKTAIMRVNKCDEKTADDMIIKINAEQSSEADFFGSSEGEK